VAGITAGDAVSPAATELRHCRLHCHSTSSGKTDHTSEFLVSWWSYWTFFPILSRPGLPLHQASLSAAVQVVAGVTAGDHLVLCAAR
jgi:hypothetical protein